MFNSAQISAGEGQSMAQSGLLRECLRLAQHIWDTEERRRVSMALSARHETAAKFAELRREIRTMLVKIWRRCSLT